LLIKALQAMSAKLQDDPIEFYTGELAAEMNRLAIEEEMADAEEKFTNARRIGHLLDRLRFEKAQRTAKGKRWKVSRDELNAHARAYGMRSLS
jgi:hypothetical protein